MFKIFALVIILLSNCASLKEVDVFYKPSPSNGCSEYQKNDERLKCISQMISEYQDIQNSEIKVTNERIQRISEEYVLYKETYCYVLQKSNKKYLCFEAQKKLYEPTALGKIWNFTKTVGFGILIGLVGGVYAL